jgi:hypothetical protein
MFLFRRKNENNVQPAADPTKAELLRPDKNKKGPEKAKGQIVEAESVVETIEKAQADFPVKVVIPASALKEEAAQNPAVESALPVSGVPDEVADSLLTPGHQGIAKTAVDPAAARPAAAPDPAPATIPDPKKAIQAGEGKDNMFSSLFGNAVEEEENILDRLFKSLPEISMEEILREAEEVKSLIKEFSKSQVG